VRFLKILFIKRHLLASIWLGSPLASLICQPCHQARTVVGLAASASALSCRRCKWFKHQGGRNLAAESRHSG